jgi:hypothetical protein
MKDIHDARHGMVYMEVMSYEDHDLMFKLNS